MGKAPCLVAEGGPAAYCPLLAVAKPLPKAPELRPVEAQAKIWPSGRSVGFVPRPERQHGLWVMPRAPREAGLVLQGHASKVSYKD